MLMDAIVATVVDGGRAIVDIDIEAGRNKLIYHLLYNFILNTLMAALSNPFQRGSQGWGVFLHGNHATRLENYSSWWGCLLCDVCFDASKKSSKREFFVPAGMHLLCCLHF
jgi:hypothetical protein